MDGIFEFFRNLVPPLGQAGDFGLAMIDLAQPVVEMGTRCFWV